LTGKQSAFSIRLLSAAGGMILERHSPISFSYPFAQAR
jgi:hypothetical protein